MHLKNYNSTSPKKYLRLGIHDTHINIIKAIYSKQTANFKLNGENLGAIPKNQGQKRLPHSLSIYLI
jgi:alpha-galactosidase/6-phospho-beta-glucosidase family protein